MASLPVVVSMNVKSALTFIIGANAVRSCPYYLLKEKDFSIPIDAFFKFKTYIPLGKDEISIESSVRPDFTIVDDEA